MIQVRGPSGELPGGAEEVWGTMEGEGLEGSDHLWSKERTWHWSCDWEGVEGGGSAP